MPYACRSRAKPELVGDQFRRMAYTTAQGRQELLDGVTMISPDNPSAKVTFQARTTGPLT
jgi:hypothetical protein